MQAQLQQLQVSSTHVYMNKDAQLQQKDAKLQHKDDQIQRQGMELRAKALRQQRDLQTLRVRKLILYHMEG